jgi:hypothetical protein
MASRRGPDNSVRISINGSYWGVANANVFSAQCVVPGTPTQAQFDAWVAAFGAAYINRFKNHQSVSQLYSTAKATYFLPGGLAMESVQPLAGAGTDVSGADDPGSVCAVISWLANVYWRGGKPRTYLPGLRTADRSGAIGLSVAGAAAIDGNAGLFMADINALAPAGFTSTALGFVSFRSGLADRVPPIFFPFTGHRVHLRLGTQRRRLGHYVA